MKKLLVILLFLIPLLLIAILILGRKQEPTATIKGTVFNIHIAKTDEEKEKGLSIFEKINQDEGMLFVFDNPDYYAFWMRDMKFPIDIIYIYNDKIVDIFKKVQNPKTDNEKLLIYKPSEKANYVLEINAGLSDKYNFKKGDIVKIKF